MSENLTGDHHVHDPETDIVYLVTVREGETVTQALERTKALIAERWGAADWRGKAVEG